MNARAPDRPAAVDDHRAAGRVAAAQTEGDLTIYERDWPAAWLQSDTVMEVRR